MTRLQHIYDVVVRSLKTGLAVYASFLALGGFNVLHVSGAIEAKVVYAATLATAVLNTAIKFHSVVVSQVNAPPSTPPAALPAPDATSVPVQ